jgi:hypothetical protein
MQLDGGGETIILVGAKHVLSHKVDKLHPTFNANAYPAYQYFNADKSIALVPEQSIDRAFDRGNKDATPEYAVWVKNKDKSMKSPALFIGQKTAMEKLFGDKISLLPKSLLDLDPPTKYESHIVIQKSDDEIADIVRKEQVEKLHKKHNKEDVLVIKKMQNGEPIVLQGNIQNVEGEYKVHIIGRGHKDKHGTEKLAGEDGNQIAQGLKVLEESIQDNFYAKLTNVLLLNCCGAASGIWGANLVKDFKKAFNNESVKIKIKIRNNIDSEHQEKTILNEELLQDNKAPTDTKPQQQSSTLEAPRKPQNKPSAKSNNQTPNKKDGGVVIYKVGTDNIITEAPPSSFIPTYPLWPSTSVGTPLVCKLSFKFDTKLVPLSSHLSEWHPVTDTLRGGCSGRMVFRSVAICCWVLPSMVASSPMPLTCPVILTL